MAQDADPSHGDQDRPPILETGADTPGDTRFGPRPVPKGHRHPAGPSESRRIPPHGDVSPDGHRVWPRPSPTAKWLVWGGTALAAAAVTVGAVIAARHVLDALSDKDADRDSRHGGPRSGLAPRFADLSPDEREAMRRRAQSRDDEDARHLARLRAEAEQARAVERPRRRPRRASFAQEVETNAASLRSGIESLMMGVTAFRSVASQASGIMREFDGASGIIGAILGRKGDGTCTARDKDQAAAEPPMPDLRDDPLTHDPLDGPDADGPSDHNPRLHRL